MYVWFNCYCLIFRIESVCIYCWEGVCCQEGGLLMGRSLLLSDYGFVVRQESSCHCGILFHSSLLRFVDSLENDTMTLTRWTTYKNTDVSGCPGSIETGWCCVFYNYQFQKISPTSIRTVRFFSIHSSPLPMRIKKKGSKSLWNVT